MRKDAVEARQYLAQAEPSDRAAAEVIIDLYDMAAARSRADSTSHLRHAGHAIELLDSTPRRLIPAGRHYRAIATSNLGVGHLWAGNLDDARTCLTESERDASELGMPLVRLNSAGHRSVLDALTGRLRESETASRAALQVIDSRAWASEPQALPT